MTIARGIRNNNPGNIRKGIPWNGLSSKQTDSAFSQFVHPTYGIRALCRLLNNYQKFYGLDTIAKIIGRYAPDIENDTNAYAEHVSRKVGIPIDEPIDLADRNIMFKMVSAIIQHENGSNPYTYEIDDGIRLS